MITIFELRMPVKFQHIVDTPMGWFRLIGTESHITSSQWIDDDEVVIGSNTRDLSWPLLAKEQLDEYFKGRRTVFTLPLKPEGSDFQLAVWDAISAIPAGGTMTYAAIAESLGDVNKARAVGGAAGDNPLLLLIPCHRIIGTSGNLTGYAAGVHRKKALLELEDAFNTGQLSLF